jgi:glycosyltransferase involved in cell wall biosynthesis
LFSPISRSDFRMHHKIPAERVMLGFVGRLHAHKDPHFVLHVAHGLAQDGSNIGILFAGDGPLMESLQALATRLGILDRCIFMNAVLPEDLGELYSALDAVLMPGSRREGMPLVPLEADANGCPVIGSIELSRSVPRTISATYIKREVDTWVSNLKSLSTRITAMTSSNAEAASPFSKLNMVRSYAELFEAQVLAFQSRFPNA